MKQRVFLLIVIAVLLMILGALFLVIKDDATRLIVTAPSGVLKAGDEFEVSVTLENNPGIAIFCLWMEYDDTRFDFVSISNGPVLDTQLLDAKDVIFNDSSTVRVTNGLRVEAFTGDGVLYSVKFKVKDSATSAKATFALSYRDGDIVGEPKQPGNQPNNFAPETIDGTVSI